MNSTPNEKPTVNSWAFFMANFWSINESRLKLNYYLLLYKEPLWLQKQQVNNAEI